MVNKSAFQANNKISASRMLIVSYSYSGNTHRIAQEIQAATKGEWCEIYPWQPYPLEFQKLLMQAKAEIKARYLPRILPANLSALQYSVIFAGSPNWCGTIAPPLASWLYHNDLTGKIILPFYSHCGGIAGDIRSDISKLCPKADVREALGVIDDGCDSLAENLGQWLIRAGIADSSTIAI